MDRRNPHNSYYYKPLDQAAPIYVPPSNATKRIQPVPQKEGQTDYHYGMPGQASPVYVPPSSGESRSAKRKGANGMMAKSDRESKTEIKKLNAKNEALMAALDDASQSAPQGSNMPATEYPKLPSHTSFSPADRVAAQNVGIQAATQPPAPPQAQPPQVMQPAPQQQNFARSGNPAFNVGAPMPDMSALDEAYRRQSQGG